LRAGRCVSGNGGAMEPVRTLCKTFKVLPPLKRNTRVHSPRRLCYKIAQDYKACVTSACMTSVRIWGSGVRIFSGAPPLSVRAPKVPRLALAHPKSGTNHEGLAKQTIEK